jgi:hypothetical protein
MQEKWRRVSSRASGKKHDRGDLQRLPPLLTVLAGGDNHRYLFQWKYLAVVEGAAVAVKALMVFNPVGSDGG